MHKAFDPIVLDNTIEFSGEEDTDAEDRRVRQKYAMKRGTKNIVITLPEEFCSEEEEEKQAPPPAAPQKEEWNDVLKYLVCGGGGDNSCLVTFESYAANVAMNLFQRTNLPPSLAEFNTNMMLWREFHLAPLKKPPVATKSGRVRNAWTGEIYDGDNPLETKRGKKTIIRVGCTLNPSEEECLKIGLTQRQSPVQIVVSQEEARILQAHHAVYHMTDYLKAIVEKHTATTRDWKKLTGKQHDKPVSKWAWAGSSEFIQDIVRLRKIVDKLSI